MPDQQEQQPGVVDVVHAKIDKELQDSLAALAHKHVTVSYTLIGVLIFVLLCGGIGAYFAAKLYDKQLARAEAAEKLMVQYKDSYDALNRTYQQELTQHAADRAAYAQKELQLNQALAALNKKTDQKIQDVTKPGKSAEDAYADLKTAYKDNPTVAKVDLNVSKDPTSGEQLMTFPVPVVQQFTATKIDRDRQVETVANLNQQLDLEKKTNDSLNKDLKNLQDAHAQLQKTEAQCEQTVKDYKKVAKKSKFKRIMGGVLKGVLFATGVYVGHKL